MPPCCFMSPPLLRLISPRLTNPSKQAWLRLLSSPSTPTDRPLLPLPRHMNSSKGLLLVDLPSPPKAWPSHIEMADPIAAAAGKAMNKKGVVVIGKHVAVDNSQNEKEWKSRDKYRATLHLPEGRRRDVETLDLGILKNKEFMNSLDLKEGSVVDAKKEILVCTHGARDCACSDFGGALVDALRTEVDRRGLKDVVINEVSHVGGHKFAANAILLPSLHMLGNLRSSHAPSVIDHLLSNCSTSSPMWSHFRGAYGLTESEQTSLFEESQVEQQLIAKKEEKVEKTSGTAGKEEYVTVRFSIHDGSVTEVVGRVGETLMDLAKREGLGAVEGVCGGHLECATCHIYLPDEAPSPEVTDEEEDMLGYALDYREGCSRLSCQIPITKKLAEWTMKEERGVELPRY